MCNLHFAIHQGSPSFYIFTHEKIIMSFAITDLLLNTGVFKGPAIVRLYQIQTPLREPVGLYGRTYHGEQEQGYDGHFPGRHGDTGLTGTTAQGFGSAPFFYFLKQE